MITIDCTMHHALLQHIGRQAYEALALEGDVCIEVQFVRPKEIRAANHAFRNADQVTDVLSFPYITEVTIFDQSHYPADYDESAGCVRIGSILICEKKARQQAAEYGHSFERETGYLFLHGMLHLLGYDHIREEDKIKMRQKEEAILHAAGVYRT